MRGATAGEWGSDGATEGQASSWANAGPLAGCGVRHPVKRAPPFPQLAGKVTSIPCRGITLVRQMGRAQIWRRRRERAVGRRCPSRRDGLSPRSCTGPPPPQPRSPPSPPAPLHGGAAVTARGSGGTALSWRRSERRPFRAVLGPAVGLPWSESRQHGGGPVLSNAGTNAGGGGCGRDGRRRGAASENEVEAELPKARRPAAAI